MIHINCGCGKSYNLPETMAGAVITCEKCGQPYSAQPEVNGRPHPVPRAALYPPPLPPAPSSSGLKTALIVVGVMFALGMSAFFAVLFLAKSRVRTASISRASAITAAKAASAKSGAGSGFGGGLFSSRMAANEVAATASCKAYASAQEIYFRTDWNKDGVLEYAQHLGGNDSLLETTKGAEDIGLVDRAFAAAEGAPFIAKPKAGYCFKILTKQGPNASGGALSYMVNGRMTKGFALVAYPAQFDSTGRNTFIINNAGTIYQKDLGGTTSLIVQSMDTFDPDSSWVVTE